MSSIQLGFKGFCYSWYHHTIFHRAACLLAKKCGSLSLNYNVVSNIIDPNFASKFTTNGIMDFTKIQPQIGSPGKVRFT